jgi:hypothetical protein
MRLKCEVLMIEDMEGRGEREAGRTWNYSSPHAVHGNLGIYRKSRDKCGGVPGSLSGTYEAEVEGYATPDTASVIVRKGLAPCG